VVVVVPPEEEESCCSVELDWPMFVVCGGDKKEGERRGQLIYGDRGG
jgi:hypothetical protein